MPRLPILTLSMLLVAANTVAADEPARRETSLNGAWHFRRDGAADDTWKSVAVPSVFQEHEGNDWHGVGWYQRNVDAIKLPPGRRLLLHFDAAATKAEVWWNDEKLGEHLGGWTPFRFDVTELIRKKPDGPHTIRVRLDEKVGHNTQGFLPIIQPHFGGLWQGVKLIEVPEGYIDDLSLFAFGRPDQSFIELRVAFIEPAPTKSGTARYRLRDSEWSEPIPFHPPSSRSPYTIMLPIREPKAWNPESPHVYEVELNWGQDRVVTRAAFRTIETDKSKLLLNGQPLVVRGVLNWGFYPPRLAPMPDRERWRRDIKLAKAMGFNLMKFCLWVPPREFFDLCDEEGMLVWQEYPTWHPKLDQAHKADLLKEYEEFYAYDRNHPSIILRSLTCETGASADLGVIRELYDLAKKMIPGCIVEDDSSWIEWNRISDFFDDHPYGNNHTWPATLKRLREYAERKGPKPLLLGEAIAADTWIDPEPWLKKVGNERPYWLPGFLDGNKKWLDRMRSLYGDGGLDRLGPDSLRYAMLMRKYQIETFRREVPDGGYVVSVIRDFPLAGMGLLGFDDQPKWPVEDWAWHAAKTKSVAAPANLPEREDVRTDLEFSPRFDESLLTRLEHGAKVIMLADGEKGSFPLRDHWFLRGGPYLPDHPIWQRIPREFVVERQHFELAGRVIPDIQFLDEIDPVILLWDNHDIKEVKTHGLVFETRVGKGRLFVSTLNHSGEIGQAVLSEFCKHVTNGPMPKRELKRETIRRMHEKLREKKLELAKETWRFKPDADNSGVANDWHKPELKLDDSWKPIRVGKHWEGQGWPRLDGWAWYRLDVTIPLDWAGQPLYLSFEGVDDHYEAYVNGTKIGGGGDIATKRTAFEERASFKLPDSVKPGEKCTIAIRVFDWYGAGGIHRPVTLGTAELPPGADVLR